MKFKLNAVVSEVTYKPLTKDVFDTIKNLGISDDQISQVLDSASTESGLVFLDAEDQDNEVECPKFSDIKPIINIDIQKSALTCGWLIQEVRSNVSAKLTKKKRASLDFIKYELKFGAISYAFVDVRYGNQDVNFESLDILTSNLTLVDLAGTIYDFDIQGDEIPYDFSLHNNDPSFVSAAPNDALHTLEIKCGDSRDLAAVLDWLNESWHDEIRSIAVLDLVVTITSDSDSIDSIQENAPFVLFEETKKEIELRFVRR
jgi:hypothetical protein